MDASLLFENDNNVEIASSRSCHSWQDSSSEALQPPTSDSEGMFDNPGDSGEEEVDNDDNFLNVFPFLLAVPTCQNLAR